jgi:DNA-binding NarL/FixJ family response regulator
MKSERVTRSDVVDTKQQILLVDDHPVVCEGLAQRINAEPDLAVCGRASDGHSALDAIEKLRPHIAVVDIALGAGSGVELIKDIKVRYPHLPALVLSMHDEQLYAERSLHAGAKGYVMKQEETTVLLRAIRQVLRGELYLSEKVKNGIVRRLGGIVPDGEAISLIKQLSDRELEVFQLIGDGFATYEIANRLHISVKTIASHRENIKRKLNLSGGEQLARFAIHWLRYRDAEPEATVPEVTQSSQPRPAVRRKPTLRQKTVSAA